MNSKHQYRNKNKVSNNQTNKKQYKINHINNNNKIHINNNNTNNNNKVRKSKVIWVKVINLKMVE